MNRFSHIFPLSILLLGCSGNVVSVESLVQDIVVEKVDLDLLKEAPTERQMDDLLWDRFIARPEFERFSQITTDGWHDKLTTFSSALVRSAQQQQLDAESLRLCLAAIAREATTPEPMIPVGAFHAMYDSEAVWIIVGRWAWAYDQVSEGQPREFFSHVCAYVLRAETGERLWFVTCD